MLIALFFYYDRMKGIFMKNFISFAASIPDEFSHLTDAKVPSYIMNTVMALMVAIAIVLIVYIVVSRRKINWLMSGLFGGVAVYLMFHYYLLNMAFSIIGMTPVRDNVFLYSIICGIVGSGFMIGGRLLLMKLFYSRANDFRGNLSFGVGIMCTEAVFMIVQLLTVYLSCFALNTTGAAELITEGMAEADIVSLMETIQSMMNYRIEEFILLAAAALVYMTFHLMATAPIFAAHEGKISKGWYAIVLGFMAVLKSAEYISYQVEVNPLVFAAIILIVGAAAVYIFYKLYAVHYKSEEYKNNDNSKTGGGYSRRNAKNQPPKKMPKFENLSKL